MGLSVKKYKLDTKEYKNMLNDICSDYCSEENCILKEFLISAHTSPRLLMQMKCVEKFKKVIATKNNKNIKDITWGEAMTVWIDEGYAKKFASLYSEQCKFRDIYKKTMLK